MNIVVAVRCYNEARHIPRFLNGYSFANKIVISDGGSTDGSVEIIKAHPLYEKVTLIHFAEQETVNGQTWNPDAPHMNFVLDAAKELKPDWLIFDDMDDVPNMWLRMGARLLFDVIDDRHIQINVFRLYMWGNDQYFPHMNRDFDLNYTSLWAWRPDRIDIHADSSIKHGTLVGLHPSPWKVEPPMCLLHKSWHPNTVQQKIDRYNAIGLPMNHPFEFAGNPTKLPEWAVE